MRHLELLGQKLENVIRIYPKKSSVISSAHFFFRMVQTGEAGKTIQSDLFEGDLAGVWLDSFGGGKDHWQEERRLARRSFI